MKATLTFLLPDHQAEFENCAKGVDWLCFAIDLDRKVRDKLKYEEITAEQRATLEHVRDWIIAGLDERGLRLLPGLLKQLTPIMTKREVAKQFILKHPTLSTRACAWNLLQLEPLFFNSIEDARGVVKKLRGVSNGKRRGRSGKIQDQPKPSIPESSEHVWIPWDVEATNKDIVALFSDIHVPYHTRQAVELAMAEAVKRRANVVLLNGDTMDAHELSRFEKDPRERCFREELPLVKQLLEYIRHKLPKARIIWKDGNHDERLYLYLRRNAPAVLGLDCFEAPAVLDFDKYGVEYVTGKRPIICGKLNILHGHEYPASSLGQVNPARGLFLRAGACTIEGHFHQTSEHSQPTLEGKNVSCWSTGSLCELHPPYMPLNKWNHGFAMIEMGKDGNFKVRNHKIINGEVY